MSAVKLIRKYLLFVIAPLIISSVSYADCSNDNTGDANSFSCVEFERVYDGDTFFINLPGVHDFFGESISVRIRGIDTGEVRDYKGRTRCEVEMAHRAKNEVAKVLKRTEKIELKNIERGKYFRLLADVYVDGELLSEDIIYKQLAVEYFGESRSGTDWCELKEKADALKEELGIE